MILERSRLEAEAEEELRKKNAKLMKMMESMEEDKKIAGWGFKPKQVEGKSEEEKFNAMQDNLQKAI